MAEEATVTKSGEQCITISIDRSKNGTIIEVHALPRVEEFIQALGTGEKIDAQTVGRYWTSMDADGRLPAYITQPLPDLILNGITIDRLGGQLSRSVDDRGKPLQMPEVNISFLRLCGISDPTGARFGLKVPMSTPEMRKLRDQLGEAARRFYLDYLRPIDVSVIISVQEVSRLNG